MADARATYPLLRGRRRGRRVSWPGAAALLQRRGARAVLAVLLLAIVAAALSMLARRADVPDAAVSMQRGTAALARANYSAARNDFIAAVTAEPGNAAAQRALAETYLLLGNGVAAQGAIDRARSAGLPAAQLHHLRAAALLLQGDEDGAIAEADRAGGRFVTFAQRAKARALAEQGDRAASAALLQQVIARVPRDSAAWSDLGRIRLDIGDVGGATAAAQRALALAPNNLAALVLRGELVRGQYGLVAALPWFEAALSRDAYYHRALIEYAGTLGEIGRNADSVAAARRALAARPGDPQALYLMAVVAARAGDVALASALLERSNGGLDGLPGGLLLSGGIDYANGRYEQAAVKWRALLGAQPMNLVARRLLGAALLRSGDAKGALDTLRPVALRADADSYTLTLVARAFEARGERDWAARFLDRAARPPVPRAAPFGQDSDTGVLANAVVDAPNDPAAAVAFIRGLVETGGFAEAIAASEGLSRSSPGVPPAHILLGDVDAASGRFAAAATAYVRAADLRFDEPTLLRLVEAWAQTNKRAQAADALALYLAQNPGSVVARRLLANLQLVSGDFAGAVRTLEQLRGMTGDGDALVLTQLGYAYTGAGDPRAALPFARAAYRLSPMSAGAADAYGAALFAAGDTAAALQLLTKAARLAPTHAGIRWHEAQALADAGQVRAARASLGIALADPAFGERPAATRLLAALPR
ncbi:tetratricopeptide repeat protein [Sphingomonas sp. HHU CXW]|uniref:Tetratricopeptide repeat protein n=1 Tax=Sphingomonas hominis TaxID=2741495 RepID=A0ABX2JCQ4_9SPHN|nr:tetratricopeptide repeat protein [Sphingomonas hominis]NTS63891.1 tetratricopeptide repeat protein [Sphingomonas hominis]